MAIKFDLFTDILLLNLIFDNESETQI